MPAPWDKIVVVGASTGGTEALRVLLSGLPADSPGLVVVLHMPEHFAAGFAARLAERCPLEVKVAAHGDAIVRGRALIAPGGRHAVIKATRAGYGVALRSGPPVSRHCPSIDVLFRSAAGCAGARAVGVILTGMGNDGASGLHAMRRSGAVTIAQDEASCMVFDMPRAAIAQRGVDLVLPLHRIASELLRRCRVRAHRAVAE